MGKEIVEKSISELKPYDNNPRHNEGAISKVVESIKEFGFTNPILIDNDNVIIAGHTRYEASKMLDLDVVPCIVLSNLTEKQIKAYRLIDNKTSEFAKWDFEKLDEELKELDEIDLELFGFEDCEAEIKDFEDEITPDQIDLDSEKDVIVIECNNDNELQETYMKLLEEGYKCKISTL